MTDSPVYEPLFQPLFNFLPDKMVIGVVVAFTTLVLGSWVMIQQLFGPWVERKVMARMQGRRGPTYVGWKGILQIPADLLKLVFKEDIMPARADRLGFFVSIALISITSIVSFAPLPWGTNLMGANFGVGILYVFAVFSLFPPAMFIGGWSSNSKYALIGGFRSAGQLLAYEIPMFLSGIAIIAVNGTFSLRTITENQMVSGAGWNLFSHQLGFLGLITGFVFFIAGVAESERIPFDIPEAEAELVMGPRTEFSGWRYALIMMVEYIHLTVNSLLFIYLFFGGYDAIPWVDLAFEHNVVVQIIVLTAKLYLFVMIAAWLRSALPRMRIDQLLSLGWKQLLPIALIASIGTLGFVKPSLLGLGEMWKWIVSAITFVLIFIFMYLHFSSTRRRN